jgi:large repetitive protein
VKIGLALRCLHLRRRLATRIVLLLLLSFGTSSAQTDSRNVELSWAPSQPSTLGYLVYRGSSSGGPYALLDTSLIQGTSFTHNDVQPSSVFFYVVTAVDDNLVESAFSNEVRVVIPGPPIVVSVDPGEGNGEDQIFSFQFSDVSGASNISGAVNIINSFLGWAGSCSTYYDRGSNQLYLINDAGDGWSNSSVLGAPGTLTNKSCSIDLEDSSATTDDTTLTLNLAITFQSAFRSATKLYGLALNSSGNSGWSQVGTWVPTNAPAPLSVTPDSGDGRNQNFKFEFSDDSGADNIAGTATNISSSLGWVGSCSTYYDRGNNQLYLINDAGDGWLGPQALGTSGVFQNSACSIALAQSSATISGETLTLNLAITFQSGFIGTKNIYGWAQNNSGASDWSQLGTWTPEPDGAPKAVSVIPSSGRGIVQIFSFQFSDVSGASNISGAVTNINSFLGWTGSCGTYYDRGNNQLYLINDAGDGWSSPQTLGTLGLLQNSSCSIVLAGSSAFVSGNILTLNLAITFNSTFGGTKNVYGWAQNNAGSASDWSQLGIWTPASAAVPTPVSVTPSSGGGVTQSFSFQFSDASGAGDIAGTAININSALGWAGSCGSYYDRGNNQLYLINDAGDGWLGPQTLGTSGTLQNSSCSIDLEQSSATGSGDTLTINLAITFQSGFIGAKNIYGWAQNNSGSASDWSQLGIWTPR